MFVRVRGRGRVRVFVCLRVGGCVRDRVRLRVQLLPGSASKLSATASRDNPGHSSDAARYWDNPGTP